MSLSRGVKSDITMEDVQWLKERIEKLCDFYENEKKGVFIRSTHGNDIRDLRDKLTELNVSNLIAYYSKALDGIMERYSIPLESRAKYLQQASSIPEKVRDYDHNIVLEVDANRAAAPAQAQQGVMEQLRSTLVSSNEKATELFREIAKTIDDKFTTGYSDKMKKEIEAKGDKHHYVRMLAMTVAEIGGKFSDKAVTLEGFDKAKDISIPLSVTSQYDHVFGDSKKTSAPGEELPSPTVASAGSAPKSGLRANTVFAHSPSSSNLGPDGKPIKPPRPRSPSSGD